MKKLLYISFLLISSTLFAQKFSLDGIVKDQDSTSLEGATVYLQSISDSVPMSYGITNKKGEFSLQVNAEEDKKAIFNIAYLGYKPYTKEIDVPNGDQLNLGVITLENQVEELNEISVVGKAPPVVIKKDTIEYNADSFKTMPNDMVEDLLRKLPGVEIDMDGGITYNGIEVEAINVDGMEFFGDRRGDVALKNIPSNAVSKVQVTDYKTDTQKFTGEESDSGTKEINLKIKKGKNRAYFGDVNVGYGTDEKYQANANLFQLIEGKQLGVIMGTNNINMTRGFNSLPDATSSTGYIESDFIGANFAKGKWNETRINADYRYSAQNTDRAQKSYSENFLPDFNYITNSNSSSYNDSDSHNAGSELRFLIKPKNEASRKQVRVSNNTRFNASNNDAFSTTDRISEYENGDLVSKYFSTNSSSSSNYSINNDFNVASRLGGRRDFLVIGFNTNFDKQDSEGSNYSRNELESSAEDIIQDQVSTTNNSGSRIGFYGRWSKEILPDFRIIPGYNATVNTQVDEKSIYDFNEDTQEYDSFNDQISIDSRYVSTTVSPSLRLRYDHNDFRFEIGATHTNTFRKYTDNIIEARNFKNDFQYLTYNGRIRYRDEKGYKNISLDYRQNVDLPNVNQLQPIANVSNITNIVTGNPDLKPGVSHNIDFGYQNNLAANKISLSAGAEATFVNDKIINSTITDTDLIRYTTFENINGDYTFSGNAGISKSFLNKKTNYNISLRMNGDYRNIRSIQNAIKFTAKTNTLRPSLSFSYSYDKKIEISSSYSYGLTNTTYNTDAFNDNDFFVQNLRLESSVFFLKDAFFTNKLSYRYNSRVGDDFDGAAIFWNAGLGMTMFEKKATLTLVGYDILGKNNGFNRSVTETSIRDVENMILEQYFMVTFVYKFGKFAGQNMMDGRRDFRGGGRGGFRGRPR
ncbi:outer membrane beta-barrel protein [Flavobacteriaceae bacterium SZ-1-7]|uniref:outer membrane beta-barrel protein n=1 Tax=Tamlana sedimenti TaxID=3134126 RepID=UPI0031210D03